MVLDIQFVLIALSIARLVSGWAFPDCVNGPLKTNGVCNTSLSATARATALVNLFTADELINNTVNSASGVSRLGLPSYQWWSEALHGLAASHGVTFTSSGNFSSASSFPQPILTGATFDDPLVLAIATVISTEARAFNNVGRGGLDFWTPNINPFKDPRWGRGQETPGEDPFRVQQYVKNLVNGLQGGVNPSVHKLIATCKHWAGYDLESSGGVSRTSFNVVIPNQDLVEYYLAPFQTCVRDAQVNSVMCSYNSVNGIPQCADTFMIQNILRQTWGLQGYIVSDCDAVQNIFNPHNYTTSLQAAAADALKAGVDLNCGGTYTSSLPTALSQGLISMSDLQEAVIRMYTSLVRTGYFDPLSSNPYRSLTWSDVNTADAQNLAYRAAVEGIVLLKNDGTLPLESTQLKIAIIGPMAQATVQMQGNYFGTPPFLISPQQGLQSTGYSVTFVLGTNVSSTDSSGFSAAINAAKAADVVVYAGGIDNSIEAEGRDRSTITWPGNQLQLITNLTTAGKPLIVLQFGGGQVDDTTLKSTAGVNALLWVGYPGQSGGTAIADILSGKAAPAGRLPITQYPAAYTSQLPMTLMTLRPDGTSPGRTYRWYNGTAVYPFGFGLHYTNFTVSWTRTPPSSFNAQTLVSAAPSPMDTAPFATWSLSITNTGTRTSDYVAMMYFIKNNGPRPFEVRELVSYVRAAAIAPGETRQVDLPVTLGSLARVDTDGNMWVYPGTYQVQIDNPKLLGATFAVAGTQAQISTWPQR